MPPRQRLVLQACGATALMVCMGIGRFAFTAVLPGMQADNHFSNGVAGLMASLNLAGYLAGALVGGRLAAGRRAAFYRLGLVVSVLAVAAMALPLGVAGWTAVRLAAGIASGLGFVLATAFVLESGAAGGPSGAAVHFAGVGLGIVLSGLAVELDDRWQWDWGGLAVAAAILAVPAWALARHPVLPHDHPTRSGASAPRRLVTVLTAAYSLEGLGYIVSGTFLVSVLRGLPETAGLGALAWVIVGVAAAPSILLWARLSRRIGPWLALAIAYAVQAVGVALPVAGGAAAALVSGVLYGGTFAGITGISLGLGAVLQPAEAGRAAARLTVLYGVGQALGPLLAGLAAGGQGGGFTVPLLGAALVIAVAGVLSVAGHILGARVRGGGAS